MEAAATPTKKREGHETGPRSLMYIPPAAFPVPMPCVFAAAGPVGGGIADGGALGGSDKNRLPYRSLDATRPPTRYERIIVVDASE